MENPDTKYETGVWYGWNGGPCPVHPETVVEVTNGSDKHVMKANSINWNFAIAFRVVTPYVPIADATEEREYIALREAADALATACDSVFDNIDATGTQEFYVALDKYREATK